MTLVDLGGRATPLTITITLVGREVGIRPPPVPEPAAASLILPALIAAAALRSIRT